MRSTSWICATAALALVACGGSDSGGDGTTTDSAVDVEHDTTSGGDSSGGTDTTVIDAPKDTTPATDSIVGDSTSTDSNGETPSDGASDGACACVADWCGCGTCDPAQIVCTKSPPGCPLGCASSCPQLATTVCTCEADRCVLSGATGPVACYKDPDCPPGDCCAHAGPVGVGGRGTCKPDGDPCCGAGCP